MRIKPGKIRFALPRKKNGDKDQNKSDVSKYSTLQYLKATGRLLALTAKSFWVQDKVASRITLFVIIAAILISIFYPIFYATEDNNRYDVSRLGRLLDAPVEEYAAKLVRNTESGALEFNKGYEPKSGEVGGDTLQPKVTASFGTSNQDSTVVVTDPQTKVSLTLKPKFDVQDPVKNINRVIYPIEGMDAMKVYTAQTIGIKEDIILKSVPKKDTVEFKYDMELSEGLEARLESDGSIGIYGVDSMLLGEVSTATEKDTELLKKARQNGEKTQFIFKLPAPYVVEKTMSNKSDNATSSFSLEGNELTITTTGLHKASYPLSIDPTVYIETARKLMRGNNESNVDFDVNNELIQKSQTTGARIDSWDDNLDLSQGVWGHSTAAAGGFIYRSGGRTGATTKPQVAEVTGFQTADSSTFTMNMPTTRPAGDLYIAVMCHDGSDGGALTYDNSWTLAADVQGHAALWKVGDNVSGGNEASSYSFGGYGTEEWAGAIMRITGFDATDPVTPTPTTGSNASAVSPVFPAITPDNDLTLIIRSAGWDTDDITGTSWVPAGHTSVSFESSSNGGTGSCGYASTSLDNPPAATVSTGTATMGGTVSDDYGASSIAVNPPAGSGPATQSTFDWAQLNAATKEVEVPNPGTGPCSGWCNNAAYNLPNARRGHSMVAYNGYMYVIGGLDSSGTRVSSVYIAKIGANGEPQLWHPTDPNPNNWDYWYEGQNLNGSTAKSYLGAIAYNNRMYIIGGQTNASPGGVTTVEKADILPNGLLGSWTTTGMQALPAGAGTHMQGVQVYNGYLYTIGGFEGAATSSSNLRNTVYYSRLNSDGTMNAWQSTDSFTGARGSFGGLMSYIYGAYIYLGGGCTAVNASGYCTTVDGDMQIASINADGSLDVWLDLGSLDNTRLGYSLIGWQGGLYRVGGCTVQDTSSGECTGTLSDVDYGVINPAGEVSTVNVTEASGVSPCSGGSPQNCDLPALGNGAGQGGQMLNMTTIVNGYLYVIGGCTNLGCTTTTGNTSYVAIDSNGNMTKPSTCSGTSSGAWCVDSTNQIPGGVAAAGVTTFNNRIYVVGGLDGGGNTGDLFYNGLNSDGSLDGVWEVQSLSGIGAESVSYAYSYARANPASAGSNPGNLYLLGGCEVSSGAGCSVNGGDRYSTRVYKCDIAVSGSVSGCTTTGQLQIDSDTSTAGSQGVGAHAGTVYANRIYLIGGLYEDPGTGTDRDQTMYARFDDSNNIVAESGGAWVEDNSLLGAPRRRGSGFGYNGHIYAVGGYDDGIANPIPFIEWSKVDVSNASIGDFTTSSVQVIQRWGLSTVVSNSYAYVIGGCASNSSPGPGGCSSFEPSIQTFQLYNNDSGSPASYGAGANLFSTDRFGASAAVMNGYIYLAGGCVSTDDCSDATNSVQYAALDAYGAVGSWSAGGNLPADRAWGQLEAVGGTLYYIGGQGDTATDERSEVYYTSSISSGNPTWNGTAATQGLPAARTQHAATVWDDRIYVTGGNDSAGADSNTVYISPKLSSGGNITTAWTSDTDVFDVNRTGHAMVAYANNLYVLGGYDGSNYLHDVQFATIGYKTGTISQTGTAVTGSGTSWTSAMVGSILQYRDGEVATITGFTSATSITVSVSKSVASNTGYTIQDGSVGAWSFSTRLPEPIRQGDAVAANGYMYLVGGRTADYTCESNTLVAPISANTTIATGNDPTGLGEWFETNQKYAGNRYGNATVYSQGKLYALGGVCTSSNFPRVNSMTHNIFTSDTTAHNVTMPAVVESGDLLLTFFTNDGGDAVTTPSGWTELFTQENAGNVRAGVYAKDAAGTEDGTSVDFVTSGTEQASAITYRILASEWGGTLGTDVDDVSGVSGGTSTPDPASLNPAGWGTENTLWFAFAGGSSYDSVTTFPTNYSSGWHVLSGTGTGSASSSVAIRALNAASEDAGSFTMSDSNPAGFGTVAVRPAASQTATLTGANRVVQTAINSQPQIAQYSRLIDTDTDVFPNSFLLNGLDNSIGARWQVQYRSATGGWQYRKTITFNNSQSSENLVNFPVRVSLSDPTNIDYDKTQDAGQDIRFYDSNGTTLLSHEIEKWDESGTSEVWVKVPQIDAGSTTDFIYMVYGNSAAPDGQDPTGLWSDYEAVYHLNGNFADSTDNNRDGTDSGTADIAGQIANGRDFERNDNTDHIDTGTWSVSGDELTISAMVNHESSPAGNDARYVSKAANGTAEDDHVFMLSMLNGGALRARLKTGTSDGSGTTTLVGATSLSDATWYHAATTYDGANLRLFLNGAQDATTAKTGNLRENTWDVFLGNQPDSLSSTNSLDGVLDEVRVSNVARSAEWLEAEHKTNTNGMNTFGSETDLGAYTWGQNTDVGDIILGDVYPYTPLNSSGVDTNFARFYYFFVEIDASQTFGYPEDVNRGPTISDMSLFFTSDPNKRLRHGKTFTGGEQQPLDTPCRQAVDADCPLP